VATTDRSIRLAARIGAQLPRGMVPTLRSVSLPSVAIGAIGALYALVLVLNIAVLQRPPQLTALLSASTSGGLHVAWLHPGSTPWERGVRPGDQVLALDGRRPDPRDAGVWTGSRIAVRVGTGGPAVVVDARSLLPGHDTWPLLALSPWFLLLGTLVALHAPRPEVGRATYALFASAAFSLALAPAAIAEVLLGMVAEFVATCLFAGYFVRFFLEFPTARGSARLRAGIWAAPMAVIALYLLELVRPTSYEPIDVAHLALLLAYMLLGAGLLIHAFVTGRDPEARRGLAIICASTVVAILPFAMLYLAPQLLRGTPLLPSEHAILALGILPAGFAYAILRHRTLDVRLAQRWLVHGLLWASLVALFTVAVSACRWLLDPVIEPYRTLALAAVLALLATLFFRVLYDLMRLGIDRLLFKDSYEYGAALRRLSGDLAAMADLDSVGTALPLRIKQLLNLDFAALLVRDQHGLSVCGSAGTVDAMLLADVTAAAADVADEAQLVSLGHGYLRVLLIPLHTHERLAGHLCLGPKARREPFGTEDLALMAGLGGHLAAIVRNIQLVADLRGTIATLSAHQRAVESLNDRLLRTQEEERALLAADLHDEPLQTALDIERQLAAAEQTPATIRHRARVRALIAQLRALCTRMRPAALDELGLHGALDLLALDLGERGTAVIDLSLLTDLDGARLAAATELVLYRAAQEALHNALRHAGANRIWITLRAGCDGLQLRVSDDGVGFSVPGSFDHLANGGHLGLAGLSYRVRQAGGQLTLRSTPGQGTVVGVNMPLEKEIR